MGVNFKAGTGIDTPDTGHPPQPAGSPTYHWPSAFSDHFELADTKLLRLTRRNSTTTAETLEAYSSQYGERS